MKELSQHGLPALLLTFLTEERTRNHRHCGGPADQVRFRELAPGQNALGATRRHEDVGRPGVSREQPASRSRPGSTTASNIHPTSELEHLTYQKTNSNKKYFSTNTNWEREIEDVVERALGRDAGGRSSHLAPPPILCVAWTRPCHIQASVYSLAR